MRTKAALWVGRVLSFLPVFVMVLSALMKLMHAPEMVDAFARLGFDERMIVPIGLLDLACVALYVVPRTAVVGCVLVSSYLAAAFATHLRVGDTGALPLVLAIFAWVGLYLRDDRARWLLAVSSRVDPSTS